MSRPPRNLLDFRVVIVTGKGGAGKTTVAVTLAEAARRSGMRVLLAETGQTESAVHYLDGPEAAPVGHAGREIRPGLHLARIDPFESLSEYLRLQMKLGSLVDRVLGTETFQQLLEAVPGWRELILLGKIWHLEQKENDAGQPFYDLIVVDAPATGHGLTFLDVPRVVQQAVRAGPLTQHAGWVEALIHDRERTLLLPVTLPEELPVQETCELVERARDEIDIGVDRIVVNALPARVDGRLKTAVAAFPGEAQKQTPLHALPPIASLRDFLAGAEARSRAALAQRAEVSARCSLPVVDLPIRTQLADANATDAEALEAILAEPLWPDAAETGVPPEHDRPRAASGKQAAGGKRAASGKQGAP